MLVLQMRAREDTLTCVFETAARVLFSSVTLQPIRENSKGNDRFNISQLLEILLSRLQILLDESGFSIRN